MVVFNIPHETGFVIAFLLFVPQKTKKSSPFTGELDDAVYSSSMTAPSGAFLPTDSMPLRQEALAL